LFLLPRPPPRSTLFPYTTLFRSSLILSAIVAVSPPVPAFGTPVAASPSELTVPFLAQTDALCGGAAIAMVFRYWGDAHADPLQLDRKSTRLNSSHLGISYAVFCL